MAPFSSPYDWNNWTPTEEAVLCFVFRGDEVLLIEKLRGLGAGKVNAPGGRIEPGESALSAAIRETQEEVGVTPFEPKLIGELRFHFLSGYNLRGFVFRSDSYSGEPYETVEAIPFWSKIAEIPYARMWSDDELWMPYLLRQEPFLGRFVFLEEAMVEAEMNPHSS